MIALALSPTVSGVIAVVVVFALGVVFGVIGGASTVNELERRISLLRRALATIARTGGPIAEDRALDALGADEELARKRGTAKLEER